MEAVKILVTFSILTLIVLITLPDEEAITSGKETGIYSPPLLHPSPREEIPLKDIFFDPDEFRLREDAKPILKENADILIRNSDIHIVIEGYCNNQKYTPNYNLGRKRAESTKSYLVSLGVESYRMSFMTRCSGDSEIEGHSGYLDVAWQLNSRVHFTTVEKEGGQSGRISRKLVTEGNLTNGGTEGTPLTTLKYIRLVREGKRPSSREVRNNERGSLRNET